MYTTFVLNNSVYFFFFFSSSFHNMYNFQSDVCQVSVLACPQADSVEPPLGSEEMMERRRLQVNSPIRVQGAAECDRWTGEQPWKVCGSFSFGSGRGVGGFQLAFIRCSPQPTSMHMDKC